MKKILLILLIILLVILTYYSLSKGLKIGNLNVLSIMQIKDENEKLDAKIEETNKTIDTEYPDTMSKLKTASNKLQTAKQEYLDLTNLSTNEQILKATMEESYAIELLWTKVGNHARNKGVNIEMAVTSSDTGTRGLYDLDFTVNGSYLSIINFVEVLENDSVLNFRIKNFKLVPSQGSILKATFTVKNIAIEGNTSSQTTSTTTINDAEEN